MKQLIDSLNAAYVERDEAVAMLVTAVIAGRHAVLIGPPGTAKSALVRGLAAALGLKSFSWLLTEFSTPEELFGPPDVAAMVDQGVYRRITTGKLPEAEIAFLDEVFKAGPAILNTLLSIMQERIFYNNGCPMQCPLISLIGASNELPSDDSLGALWDRFSVRLMVQYVRETDNFARMLKTGNSALPVVGKAKLEAAQEAAAKVAIPANLVQSLTQIRQAMAERGIEASDRRYKESLDLIRASAFLAGRQEAVEEDLLVLQHVLWHDPSQAKEVASIVFGVAEPLLVGIAELEDAALEAIKGAREAVNAGDSNAILDGVANLREVLKKMEALQEQVAGSSKASQALEKAHNRVRGWQAELLQALGI